MRSSSALRRAAQQALAGAVHELQPLTLVEGEDGDVDLHHHLAQQGRGFERVEALTAKRIGQDVHFEHHIVERIAAARAARADREITLAQRRQQVRRGLQRSDDARAKRGEEAEKAAADQDGEGPLDLGRVVAGPEDDHRHDRPRRGGGQREEEDALIVGQARRAGHGGYLTAPYARHLQRLN